MESHGHAWCDSLGNDPRAWAVAGPRLKLELSAVLLAASGNHEVGLHDGGRLDERPHHRTGERTIQNGKIGRCRRAREIDAHCHPRKRAIGDGDFASAMNCDSAPNDGVCRHGLVVENVAEVMKGTGIDRYPGYRATEFDSVAGPSHRRRTGIGGHDRRTAQRADLEVGEREITAT